MADLTAPSERGADNRRGLPLSFVIARYFAYAFAVVALAWLLAFLALSSAINSGLVYEASWGPAHARDVAAGLASRQTITRVDVPTAYQLLVIDAEGATVTTDLTRAYADQAARRAREALGAAPGTVVIDGGGSGLTYASFPLDGGGACVLVCTYLPQWTSHDLAAQLPNPQNLMLIGGVMGSIGGLALVARRASRVIARKMAPLTEAAARIERQELAFRVGRTNVREVNSVLDAIEAMRASLAESLEARWRSEQAQREQVASLAHDLKTPLTILRANADYIAEEIEGARETASDAYADLAAAARDIAAGTDRLDGYVRLLIDASQGGVSAHKELVRPAELGAQVLAEAESLVRARDLSLSARIDPALRDVPASLMDRTALVRAATNLVANAAEHAREHVAVSCLLANDALVIEVRDDGPGFSPAALAHGCDRLFTDDTARSTRDGGPHYGLGLHAAAETAQAHGGSVLLANDATGGAQASLSIPLDHSG